MVRLRLGGNDMRFLDLFAGIGGFRLGMAKAGHECVGFCEIDKFARKSYKAIYDTDKEVEFHDITQVTDDTVRGIGSVEIICGGFPCQAFSIAGNRRGFEDTRGTLFFEIARFAHILRPKYLFLENVTGLLSHDNGNTFETILRTLDEIGYDVEWEVFNSKNFGVPQNRERVFIIGHLRGASTRNIFPFGREGKESSNEQSINVIGNIKSEHNKGSGQREVCCSTYGISGALTATDYKGPKQVAIPKIIQKGHGYNSGGEFDIAPTLTSHSYHENNYLQDNFVIRKLTPRECWRLQGFPDWAFDKAQEVNSNSQLYKQAGNSVTVNVIYEIAKRLK